MSDKDYFDEEMESLPSVAEVARRTRECLERIQEAEEQISVMTAQINETLKKESEAGYWSAE